MAVDSRLLLRLLIASRHGLSPRDVGHHIWGWMNGRLAE
jgi:hypothetical protein